MKLGILFSFIFGTIYGSFLQVLTIRLHHQQGGILRGRSQCPHCQHQLHTLDLIPVFSYLSLRGRCRYCRKPIGATYPLIELLTGGLFALSWLHTPELSWSLLYIVVIVCFLVFLAFSDLYYLSIPATPLYFAIGIVSLITVASLDLPTIYSALYGVGFAGLFFGLQILLTRGRGLGSGDLIFGVFMGIVLGFANTILAIFISYLLGSLVGLSLLICDHRKWRKQQLAFIPFLALGTFIALLYGDRLIEWYYLISYRLAG